MTRTHTISTKVTDEEKAWLEAKAATAGLTPGEWYRNTLLAQLNEPAALKLLAAEFRAMRSILFQLVTAALTHRPLNDATIQQIVAFADATKYPRGDESIASLVAALKGTVPNEIPAAHGAADSR